MTKLETNNVK